MGTFREKMKQQQGEIMLEASIILVSVLLLLLALLSISFFFYQESLMNTVANEIASDVARNLKYTETLKVGADEITPDDVADTHMFRMSFGQSTVAADQAQRGEEYAQWRVPRASLGLNPGELDVDCQVEYTGIGRACVKVTVSQRTDFFLSGVLDLLGVTQERELFSATAYAECMDLMAYTSMVNFTMYAGKVLDESGFGSIGHLYNSVKDLAQELM